MIDRTGIRYGRLVALRLAGKQGHRLLWECQCDCGKKSVHLGEALSAGITKSCGCQKLRGLIERNQRSATHGMTNTPEFNTWQGIKQRCYWPRYSQFHRYGGRGITVCDRWLGKGGFENFLTDMGKRPTRFHQLDRVNNDGNYEPGNCRWATPKEQADNRSTTVMLVAFGRKQAVGKWSKEFGIPSFTVINRIKSGWPVEKALTQPRRTYGDHG
jgi:hypothetical protein